MPRLLAAIVALVVFVACEPSTSTSVPTAAPEPAGSAKRHAVPTLTFGSPRRVVALGDVHGDLDATHRALRLAGAVDAAGAWVGGDLCVVQVGDQIDRGDDDRAILDLFDSLAEEAKKHGGSVVALNGNHEYMNAALDFRYATEGSHAPFAEFADGRAALAKLPESQRGRAAAFLPGGVYAKKLAQRPTVAVVGDSVFVHGGILPKHVEYGLEKLDQEIKAWLRGESRSVPPAVTAEDGPVWSRMYSAAPGREECATLDKVLRMLGVARMVVGHTPQKPGISPACEDKVWRIDTGMARAYGGPVQALEITGAAVRVLRE